MAKEIFVGPGGFATIGAAVEAAQPLDTIRVAPGIYNETVVIDKTIQLLGTQARIDARSRQSVPESIITANNESGVLQVNADRVVVDGFTVQGNSQGPGIATSPSFSGYWIFNNIIQNNSYGLYFNSSGTTTAQARQNLFFANDIFGNAIYSDSGSSNMYVDSNQFNGRHNSASINFAASSQMPVQSNITISNNVMFNDNSIALTHTSNVAIVGNSMFNTQGSSIFLAGGTDRTEIEGNVLHNSIRNGISVNMQFLAVPNTNARVVHNSIQGNQTAGLNIEPGAYQSGLAGLRLDATENWWGSPSGPSGKGPGTGDAVIDPDDAAEIIPFSETDTVSPNNLAQLDAMRRELVATRGALTSSQTRLAVSQGALAAAQALTETLGGELSQTQNKLAFSHGAAVDAQAQLAALGQHTAAVKKSVETKLDASRQLTERALNSLHTENVRTVVRQLAEIREEISSAQRRLKRL